jgi:hypothetical protein
MRPVALLVTALALSVAACAGAVGPSFPDVNGALTAAEVTYVTSAHASATTLAKRVEGRVVARVVLPGAFGIPMITLNGAHGGLSPDGRTLVLGSNVRPDGTLRTRSRFAVVSTARLALVRTISLPGDYSFDALSPHGDSLFLIHHLTSSGGARYQVRAYDLRTGALLPGVIADKRQAGWLMAGYPVARATSRDGRWVYTLYQQADNYPFVHALDTVTRTAVCIGLPWQWAGAAQGEAISSANMHVGGRTLTITGGKGGDESFLLDTLTFRVSQR